MKLNRIALAAVATAALAVSVQASSHNIVEPDPADAATLRINLMQNNGAALGLLAGIAKGEITYDATAVGLALRTVQNTALALPAMFPDGSNANPRSNALDAIWENRAEFDAAVAQFLATATGLARNPPQDADGVREALGALGQNCQGCHKSFRKER